MDEKWEQSLCCLLHTLLLHLRHRATNVFSVRMLLGRGHRIRQLLLFTHSDSCLGFAQEFDTPEPVYLLQGSSIVKGLRYRIAAPLRIAVWPTYTGE